MNYFVLAVIVILYLIMTLSALLERYYANNGENGEEDEFT